MRTPSPSWCGLDRTHLWPTGSSLGDPLITARNFSSCPSDSISRWTPCPPETASGGFRSALAVSDFRLRARLDVSIPSTPPASEAFNPAFGYGAPHPCTAGPRTRASREPDRPPPERITGDGKAPYERRSSGLPMQLFGVETHSFLPNG